MTSKQNESNAVGVFQDRGQAERSVEQLRQAGFGQDEIHILGGSSIDAIYTKCPTTRPRFHVMETALGGGVIGALVGFLLLLLIPGLDEFELLNGLVLGFVVGTVLFAAGGLLLRRRSRVDRSPARGYVVSVRSPQRQEEAANVLSRRGLASQ